MNHDNLFKILNTYKIIKKNYHYLKKKLNKQSKKLERRGINLNINKKYFKKINIKKCINKKTKMLKKKRSDAIGPGNLGPNTLPILRRALTWTYKVRPAYKSLFC
jgi:hypothetical protein